MSDPTVSDLQNELDEINAQLSEMVGAGNVSVGGFSFDESKLKDDLVQRKASLEWRIQNMNAGGLQSDNVRGIQMTGGY